MGLHRGPDGPSTAELLARTSQANMADHMRRHRVRWLGHAARKPNDVMVKQLLFAHSIPGQPRPVGRPHLTWMDTAMHDMDSPALKSDALLFQALNTRSAIYMLFIWLFPNPRQRFALRIWPGTIQVSRSR